MKDIHVQALLHGAGESVYALLRRVYPFIAVEIVVDELKTGLKPVAVDLFLHNARLRQVLHDLLAGV